MRSNARKRVLALLPAFQAEPANRTVRAQPKPRVEDGSAGTVGTSSPEGSPEERHNVLERAVHAGVYVLLRESGVPLVIRRRVCE